MTPEPKEVTEARGWLSDPGADVSDACCHVADLLAHIDTLAERLAEVERERDAARRDLSVALMEGANLRSNRDTDTNALQTAVDAAEAYRRERDEARTQIGAVEYADEEIRRQYGAEFGLLDPDDSPPCWADFAEHIRTVTRERDEALARVEAEHKGCNAWSAKLTKERDEARAYMPAWSRDGAALYLSVGAMKVAMIEPYNDLFLPIVRPDDLFVDTAPRWLTKADDIEAAARSICAALRIGYVPVPDGI